MIEFTPVILCGGTGTRLWPLSRIGFPKQFLSLNGSDSLFQQTVKRLLFLNSSEIVANSTIVVTGEEYRFLVSEQLREIAVELGCALLEPVGRNTAPALTLAALYAMRTGDDPILVVAPADQVISNFSNFSEVMQRSIEEADKGSVVILGVTPDRPDTGYGYIQINKAQAEDSLLDVIRFIEKPDAVTARDFLNSEGYFWNAGIFVLRASIWINMLEQFHPKILEKTRTAWGKGELGSEFMRPGENEFAEVPSESIDYAAMERCPGSSFILKMAQLDAGWSDLGTWNSIWQTLPKDTNNNAAVGDVISIDSENTLAYTTNRLICILGVKDLVVVETADAVLVVNKLYNQEVKLIGNLLDTQKRSEYVSHRKVQRPWGWYDVLDEGVGFKVKRIHVNPKASLSLQRHQHRAEHWIVVEGTAEITHGTNTSLLTENQSAYIPAGEVHRLANPATLPLEIIEVQCGSYLGEDDIVRYSDSYGRVGN
jgi:mannose-1-phosphate guanylyltransferase/mannose-6-phosphate isomerase